ncbi:MAG: 30S ribosomal protein S17 [Planctomycetota bacterium]
MPSGESGDPGRRESPESFASAPGSPDAAARAASPAAGRRKAPKTVVGKVWSDKMRKTRAVRAVRLVKHPKYGKFLRRKTTFYVHDEDEVSRAGDTVLIAQTRPLSRLKRWRLVKVIAKAKAPAGSVPGGEETS